MFTTIYKIWKQWSRLQKSIVILSFFFLFYSITGFLVVPLLIKNQLQERGTTLFARNVEIENILFNPYLFRVRIIGFKVAGKNNNPELISFSELSGSVQ